MFIIKTRHRHLITTGIESNFAQEHSKIRERQLKLTQKNKVLVFCCAEKKPGPTHEQTQPLSAQQQC